jgi:GDSL-like Lipase/Acylhydrolase family
MISFLRAFCKRRPFFVNIILIIVSVMIVCLLMEICFRIFMRSYRPQNAQAIYKFTQSVAKDDTRLRFEAHPYLSYAPTKIRYVDNGIRIGDDQFSYNKPPDVIRVACLGGSTTMNQYPAALAKLLNRWPGGKRFEVMDFGCDAWTLMESTINYMIRVAAFAPDVVIVHHGVNDGPPRLWPDFKPDYSHFRISWRESGLPKFMQRMVACSWLGVFCMQRLGISHFDISNSTIRRVPRKDLKRKLDEDSLRPYEHNLRMLSVLVRNNGGRLIAAPMAYSRNKGKAFDQSRIQECNRITRSVAQQLGVLIVDTNPLLKKKPEWFIDLVHLNSLGNNYKAQVFSMAVWDMVNGESMHNRSKNYVQSTYDDPQSRDLEICWDYDQNLVREYHVYVRRDDENKHRYLGRTYPGTSKTYRWKSGEPQLAPVMKTEFYDGPSCGHIYDFRVYPISKGGSKKVLKYLSGGDDVKVLERPHEKNSRSVDKG